MKKYLLLIGLIFCSGIAAAQTFQRTNKGPAFFMPADAMNKPQPRQQQRRILPPQPQQAQPQQPKAQPVQKAQPSATASNNLTTPAKTKPTVTAAKPKPAPQPQQAAAAKKPAPAVQTAKAVKLPATKPLAPEITKPAPIKSVAKQTAQPAPQKNVFEQIMDDYEHDIKLIGQKQKVRNERLQKVLSSFQDRDIPF